MSRNEIRIDTSKQVDLLRQMPLNDVLHGTDVPMHLIKTFMETLNPPSVVDGLPDLAGQLMCEFGASSGDKSQKLRENFGFGMMPRDVSPIAYQEMLSKGLIGAGEGDVSQFEVEALGGGSVPFFLESMDGVLMEGLLCNVVGEGSKWKRVLNVAHMTLSPSGFLFIADVTRADAYNPVMEMNMGKEEYLSWQRRWVKRYKTNKELGLPYGTFVVGKSGESKKKSWGGVDDLRELHQSDGFERFAQHMEAQQIFEHLSFLGMKVVHFENKIWESGPGYPLSGCVIVAQKNHLHDYHPWYFGHPRIVEKNLVKKPSPWSTAYFELYRDKLLSNVRQKGIENPESYFPEFVDSFRK